MMSQTLIGPWCKVPNLSEVSDIVLSHWKGCVLVKEISPEDTENKSLFLNAFFRVLQLNLWVCLWHLCSKLLTSTSPYITCAANTEIILCSVSSPRFWGPSFVDMHALSAAVICAFSVLHSPCSHCPSQIPSWRLRSPSLLMLWAAILLLQKWILVEMPWVIWEQRCWQKLYR